LKQLIGFVGRLRRHQARHQRNSDAHPFSSPPVYVLAEFLSTNFFAHQFWLLVHRDLFRALLRSQDPTASGSTVRPSITTNRSSSHSAQTRHGTLHRFLRAVRSRFIMNPEATSQEQSSFVPMLSNSSSSPSPIDFASAHPDTRIRIPIQHQHQH